jgi:hypothetical protein
MSASPPGSSSHDPSTPRGAAQNIVLVPSDWEDELGTEDDDDDMDYEPAEEDQFEGLRTLWPDTDEEVLMQMVDAAEDLSSVEIEFDLMGEEDEEDENEDEDEDDEAEVLGGTREGRPVFGELLSSSDGTIGRVELLLWLIHGYSYTRPNYAIAGPPRSSTLTNCTWRRTILSGRIRGGRC